MSQPRYQTVKASEALERWLGQMAEACSDILDQQLPPEAVKWAQTTERPGARAAYMMGAADTYAHALESVRKGLRMWIQPDTGEIIGVDVQGDPLPPGYPGTEGLIDTAGWQADGERCERCQFSRETGGILCACGHDWSCHRGPSAGTEPCSHCSCTSMSDPA